MAGEGTRGIAYVKGVRGRSAVVRYGGTLALCAVGVGWIVLLQPYWDPSFAVLPLAFIAIAAWLCGLRPALLAVAIFTVSLALFRADFLFRAHDFRSWMRIVAFLVAAALVSVLVHALTQAKETLAMSDERRRTVSEMLPFGIWVADRDGNLQYLSDSLLQLVHKPLKSIRTWGDLVSGEDAAGIDRDWQECVRQRKPWEREFTIRDSRGKVRAILSRGEPVRDAGGKITSWAGLNLDITERHLIEAERKRHSMELARSNAELEQFAYVASHDLQEPLRTIRNYLGLLEKRYQGKLDEDAHEFIHYAVDGAARLQRLINDLLQFSRVGSRAMELKEIAAGEAVKRAVQDLRQKIDDCGARVTWDELPSVRADETELVRLFQNLIDNGIKYRGHAPPHVHVSAVVDDGVCTFSVRDNGLGIDPRFADRIFLIFQRLHSSQEYPGTGIGLALAKRIVERHGGKIWVESQRGRGSTFLFTMPACAAETAGMNTPSVDHAC